MDNQPTHKLVHTTIQPIQALVKDEEKHPGRPTVITEEVVRNLEIAFQNGMSDKTACEHAHISRETYYKWFKESTVFRDRILTAKNFLKFLAGNRLVSILKDGDDRDAAGLVKFTLEKLEPEQFGQKPDVVINQNFNYQDPDWFTPPQDIIEAQEKDESKKD